ncbi:MAG: TldD/PmbA family protein [Deltaproteobacteria bacterium]|nr:TldD/PmbA family protein [Deltaproteobacteria bacterium]
MVRPRANLKMIATVPNNLLSKHTFIPTLQRTISYLKKKGVEYADIRLEECISEGVMARDGEVDKLWDNLDTGFGIRVLYKGSWGFAASSLLTETEARKIADEAILQAKAIAGIQGSRGQGVKGIIDKNPAVKIKYKAPCQIDPFTIPIEERLSPTLKATALHKNSKQSKKIHTIEGFLDFQKAHKIFLNTEGSFIEQEIFTSGAGIKAIAIDGDDVQIRSFPDSHQGIFRQGGYEQIIEMEILKNTPRIIEEALTLLKADECPSGEKNVVLGGSQVALQIHESIGHAVELDRAMGMEISLAGGTFLTPDKLGKQICSKIVNIYADPTIEGGAGSYLYDDEGIKARRVDIIKNGRFVDFLTSRETAKTLGKKPAPAGSKQGSNGSVRANGWNNIPIIRMSNINIEAAEKGSLDELIADTKDGILLQTNKSWSIDTSRLNFQFGMEIGWEIKKGKIIRPLKNPVYSGITPDFWKTCNAICGKEEWQMYGLNSCGKGDPVQSISVGHGAAPARFAKVRVGAVKC